MPTVRRKPRTQKPQPNGCVVRRVAGVRPAGPQGTSGATARDRLSLRPHRTRRGKAHGATAGRLAPTRCVQIKAHKKNCNHEPFTATLDRVTQL